MPSTYAWLVTREQRGDPEEDQMTDCAIIGPHNAPQALIDLCLKATTAAPDLRDQISRPCRVLRFQLRNGDGDLDADGWIAGAFTGFEPLDDLGEGNYGSTEVWYQDTAHGVHFGCWVML